MRGDAIMGIEQMSDDEAALSKATIPVVQNIHTACDFAAKFALSFFHGSGRGFTGDEIGDEVDVVLDFAFDSMLDFLTRKSKFIESEIKRVREEVSN